MKFIKNMVGVTAGGGNASLYRNQYGRLVVSGDPIDLFDLLHWVELNPLTQFRELSPSKKEFEPSEQFKHLFDKEGRVL